MVTKPVPNRCIWCLKDPSSTTFSSESHVLPKCVGNKRQQVLPPGIVCDHCNRSFGSGGKVEAALINDPIFATKVGILQLRDKNREFIYERSPSGINRDVHTEVEVSSNKVTVTIQYEIKGQPSKPHEVRTINKSKDYNKRTLALLSRAVHKIAFETLAHSLFVGTGLEFEKKELKDIDIFDRNFNVIRDWVRYGKPQNSVRPILRLQKVDELKTREKLSKWRGKLWSSQQWFYCELNLFGDCYIMSLTSPADKVDGALRGWATRTKFAQPVWMVGDKLQAID